MNFINVNIDIYPNNITQTNLLFLYEYELLNVKDMSFIINNGDMSISNMLINKTISRIFIANRRSLYAELVEFSFSFSNSYKPNDLHSTRILRQSADDSFMELTESYLIGSNYILTLLDGGIKMTDSVFERNNIIIEASIGANSILIKNCTFSNMGEVLNSRVFVGSSQVNKKYFIIICYNYLYVEL